MLKSKAGLLAPFHLITSSLTSFDTSLARPLALDWLASAHHFTMSSSLVFSALDDVVQSIACTLTGYEQRLFF
jgi:hypothetical protein